MSDRPLLSVPAALLVAALIPFAAACGGDSTGPESSNRVQVTLRKSGPGPGPVNSTSPARTSQTSGSLVTLADVQSIEVTVDRVEVLPVGSDGTDGWVDVPVVDDTQTVDVLLLPGSGSGNVIASTDLEAGDYSDVRLFISGATVTFSDSTTVRGAEGASDQEFEGGTPHDLTVPGGQQGLRLSTGSFTVPAEMGGNVVRVTVDPLASVGTIVVTSDQGLIVNPVLSAEANPSDSESDSGS